MTRTAELDRLVTRLQALRAKTVEQGCTEQEALAAAEKVAELLDRYGLTLSELDVRQQACERMVVETGRVRRVPMDDCIPTVAWFFDTRVWSETGTENLLRYVFFGMPADVQAALYLHDLVAVAFAVETAEFQNGPIYREMPSAYRRRATTSFQTGLALGIVEKLQAMRTAREVAASTGRALVVVKEQVIEQELEKLGMRFRRRAPSSRRVNPNAYGAGRAAGSRFVHPRRGARRNGLRRNDLSHFSVIVTKTGVSVC